MYSHLPDTGTDFTPGQTDPDSLLELETFLPYHLNMLAHVITRGIAAIYEDQYGLTAAQWRVLAAVAQYPGITAQRVVELTPMDKVTVSRAVAVLTEQDLLRRNSSKSDGRVALLSLTSEGLRIYREIAPRALSYSRALQQGLSAAQRKSYLEVTKRLIERAQDLAEPAPSKLQQDSTAAGNNR